MKHKKLLLTTRMFCLCSLAVFLFSAGVGTIHAATVSCENTMTLAFNDLQFNKPVIFTSAIIKTATATLPELCEIKGTIYPEINFVLNIPTVTYNDRFVMVGQGGTAGSINRSNVTPFLQKGFSTVVTDTGHIDPAGAGRSTDWALPDKPYADQKIIDFGYRSQHEVAVLAKKIIKAHKGANPVYSYFYGCSNAGREAMSEAQKYPEDFDGYYAGSVDQNHAEDMVGFLYTGAVKEATPSIANKACLQAQYVFAKCDGIDGLVDGNIENPKACSFDPLIDLPSCVDDVDAPNCFTFNERIAIKKIYVGPQTSWGKSLGPAYPIGSEACSDPNNPATTGWNSLLNSMPTMVAPQQIAELFLRIPAATFDPTTFNFDTDSFTVFNSLAAGAMDVSTPNLWGLKKSGGKMIVAHGLGGDHWPYAYRYGYYYDQVTKYMNAGNVDDFIKFYPQPGIAHCDGAKVGCTGVDWFTPLQKWVEDGETPQGLPASRTATFRKDGTQILTARTRPLCPYPQEARYLGTKITTSEYPDPIDYAANFACVQLEKARVEIAPNQISLTSDTTAFKAFIELSHQEDFRATSAVCEGAMATKLVRHGNRYEAEFNKADLKNMTAGDKVTFTVTLFGERQGHHKGNKDDAPTAFEGRDRIKVTK